MKPARLFSIFLLFPFLRSDAQTNVAQSTSFERAQEPIGASDTLTIAVVGSDELSKDWRVDATGRLNLPMIGTLQAAGKTPDALQTEIASLLRRYFVNPQVTVFVLESRSRPVTITGAVERPGVYQLRGVGSLSEVLVLASGPKDAGPTVSVTRAKASGVLDYPGVRTEDQNQVAELPLVDVISGHGEAAQLHILPGDIVSVSTVKMPKLIQITGEVNRPGAIELTSHDSIPLIQALGMAGGVTRTSSPKGTIILHVDAEGHSTPERIDMRKVFSGQINGVMLRPGDVVMVPANNVTAFIQAASLSAVTTGVYILGRF